MQSQPILISELLLDPDNPRLKSISPGATQFDLVKALYEEMSVDEVAMSIAENGYFEEEPLIVIPGGKANPQKFVVVEGNRRLAATMLLTDAALRNRIGASDLPGITPTAAKALSKLPCLVYTNKQQLWQFLGFRHINGVKQWDAFSKAAYIAEVHENYKVELNDIAKRIGDRHSTVTWLYRGLSVLRQAEKIGFDKQDRIRNRFYFSHLYTALDQPEFQNFLGIDSERSLRPNPVPLGKKAELRELCVWLYGSKSQDKEPVVQSQNPDLNRLREVLGEPRALAALRKGASLLRSHELSIGDTRRFEDAIYGALEDLKQANGLFASGFRKGNKRIQDSISELVVEIGRLDDQMVEAMSPAKLRKKA